MLMLVVNGTNEKPGMDTIAAAAAVTVSATEPDTPLTVAVTVTGPTVIPDTSPVVLTVATLSAEERHVTASPMTTSPFALRAVAVSCSDSPTRTVVSGAETSTLLMPPGPVPSSPQLATKTAALTSASNVFITEMSCES